MPNYILLLLFSIIFCEIPADIKEKGEAAMIDPSKPYSDFLLYKKYYQEEYGKELIHPLAQPILRPKEKTVTDPDELNLMHLQSKYILSFTSYGGCNPDTIKENKCCAQALPNLIQNATTSSGWSLVDYGTSQEEDRKFVYTNEKNYYSIFRNDIFKKIIIAVPGTVEFVIQLPAEAVHSKLTSFPLETFSDEIQMSEYFGARSYALIPQFFKESNLPKMKIDEGYQFIFTGYSLGAAMAAAECLFALDQKKITKVKNHPLIVTFGQPRTGNEAFVSTLMKEAELIYRVSNVNDFVTQIPMYGWGYRHTQGRLDFNCDKEEYSLASTEFKYDDEVVDDSQEMNLGNIMLDAALKLNVHLYYLGMKPWEYCFVN